MVLIENATERNDRLDAYFDGSLEMLKAIAGVLDIRTMFPRLSAIANRMLPHDALALIFVGASGEVAVEAASSSDFPELEPYEVSTPLPDVTLIGDLRTEPMSVKAGVDPGERLVAAGYRSVLVLSTTARDRAMSLGFWSKRPRAFDRGDVPMARRIVDHIAVAVCHEQLAAMARQVPEPARAERLDAGVRRLSPELNFKAPAGVVGESPQWRDVLRKATQVAATDTTVLVSGESGTGKEVIARFIHRASARKSGPFVALNCAALPEQLLESELFGYERGAFTSAQQAKPGQIELAARGVLFLDEVSEMSLPAQAKLLRVLQEREFQRLGGTRPLKADIRVIAATNRDLRKSVERGDFREDLYYRLSVFDMQIAPLRERRSDILPLSDAFLLEISKQLGRPPAGLTRDTREALLQYHWPGNVRELRNALERAAILCEGGLINAEHLALQRTVKAVSADTSDLNVMERDTIARVLQECYWNKSSAARRLGLSRTQLYVRLRRYGLVPQPLDTTPPAPREGRGHRSPAPPPG